MSTPNSRSSIVTRDSRNPDKHRVIAFGYKKHSGKDTAGKFLLDRKFTEISFADPIKVGIGKGVFGFSDEQCYGEAKGVKDPYWGVSPGRVFQLVGTDLFRETFPDLVPDEANVENIWSKASCRPLIESQESGEVGDYVFTDLRFPDEGEFLDTHFDTTFVWVQCPPALREKRGGEDDRPSSHKSECALDGWDGWDWVIDNSKGLAELRQAVKAIDHITRGYPAGIPKTLQKYSAPSTRRAA